MPILQNQRNNIFDKSELKKLYQPAQKSAGEDNGQVIIIGGSPLFHGAPILALKVASRIVDMVFFASPEKSVGQIAETAKSELMSFIWTPWEDLEKYIEKSDAVLIGPGLMRFASEKAGQEQRSRLCDEACQITKDITEKLLKKFPNKKWVVDAGSLQVIEPELLPKGCIVTPNKKEFELMFGNRVKEQESKQILADDVGKRVEVIVQKMAREYKIIIVLKGPETIVASAEKCVIVKGGNPGMTKGGTGDVHAGLTVALLAKNEPFLAASAAAWIIKVAADNLFKRVGVNFNADDLADEVPRTSSTLLK